MKRIFFILSILFSFQAVVAQNVLEKLNKIKEKGEFGKVYGFVKLDIEEDTQNLKMGAIVFPASEIHYYQDTIELNQVKDTVFKEINLSAYWKIVMGNSSHSCWTSDTIFRFALVENPYKRIYHDSIQFHKNNQYIAFGKNEYPTDPYWINWTEWDKINKDSLQIKTGERTPLFRNNKGDIFIPIGNGTYSEIREVICCGKMNTNTSRLIELALIEKGFDITPDNILGSKDKAALTEFQVKNKLQVGRLDPATLKALGLWNYFDDEEQGWEPYNE